MPRTFENRAEYVDVVEHGEKDEDPVEDRVELLGDEHGDGHAVADEARAPDQDLEGTTDCVSFCASDRLVTA